MAFLVTLPWTCLCGVASALARTIKVLIAQDRIVDLEKGADNSAHQDISQSGPLAAVFSAEVLVTMRRTISTISQSIYGLKRRKTSDVDVEKGHPVAELTSRPSTCATTQSIRQGTPKREDNGKEDTADSSSDYGNDSPSQSLSISSILDLMPIPVTTPEERALAGSILAARAASPSPPNTPSLISPCTDSSHDSSFTPDLDVSTMLNTPPTVNESMLFFPIQAMHSTPVLEQQSVLPDLHGRRLPAIAEGEEYNTSFSQDAHDPWMGETGFKFPQLVKLHNTIQFTLPFPVVEEDECEEEAIESRRYQVNGQIGDSPWDNGINESYGLKGRAFWRQAMKLSDSAGGQQVWINNGMQVVAN